MCVALRLFVKEREVEITQQQNFSCYLNKLSVSYNYKLYKKIYFGLNTGVLYINSNQKFDFGIKLSHLDDLSNKKRNKKQLISCGLNIATDDVFDSNSFIYIPSVSISYLF